MNTKRIVLAAAICIAAAAHAGADPEPAMSKADYEAAKEQIEAQRKADDQTCKQLKGHARDVCNAQAKGREKAELARLDARREPGPQATQDAKFAVAAANHEVAKVQCQVRKGKARGRCMDEAKAAREAAERQARVEKVRSTGGMFHRDGDGDGKGTKSGTS